MPKRRLADSEFKELTKDIDPKEIAASIQKVFGDFPDPRRTDRCTYPAWVLVLIMVCGMIAGCDTVADLAEWVECAENPLFRPLLGEKYRVNRVNRVRQPSRRPITQIGVFSQKV